MIPSDIPSLNPSIKPTDKPTNIKEMMEVAVFSEFDNAFKVHDPFSSQICGVVNENDNFMYYFGGIEYDTTGVNKIGYNNQFFRVDTYSDIINGDDYDSIQREYETYLYDDNLHQYFKMDNIACNHQCSVYYDNYLFIVMPQLPTGNEKFYKCLIDNESKRLHCRDLCRGHGTEYLLCNELKYDACVAKYNQYLLIIGGAYYNKYYNTILIWDMNNNKWVNNNMKLNIPISGGSCSVWNNKLYVFGGTTSSQTQINDIQQCGLVNSHNPIIYACDLITPVLKEARYYSRAITLGKTIIIMCGQTLSGAIDVTEIFDASELLIYEGPKLYGGPRRQCCLVNYDNKIYIYGGETEINDGRVKTKALDDVIYSKYTFQLDDGTVYRSINNDKPIEECQAILINSNDNSFNGFIFNKLDSNYYHFWEDDHKNYIYYERNKQVWIGLNNPKLWASNPQKILQTGKWNFVYSNFTTKRVYTTINCIDSLNTNNENIYNLHNLFIPIITTLALCMILIALYIKFKSCKHKSIALNTKTSKNIALNITQSLDIKGYTWNSINNSDEIESISHDSTEITLDFDSK